MAFIGTFLSLLIEVLTWAIVIRALLSWFPIAKDHALVQVIVQITEPVLGPIRRVVPTLGFIDITPLLAIFLLQSFLKPLLSTIFPIF